MPWLVTREIGAWSDHAISVIGCFRDRTAAAAYVYSLPPSDPEGAWDTELLRYQILEVPYGRGLWVEVR